MQKKYSIYENRLVKIEIHKPVFYTLNSLIAFAFVESRML